MAIWLPLLVAVVLIGILVGLTNWSAFDQARQTATRQVVAVPVKEREVRQLCSQLRDAWNQLAQLQIDSEMITQREAEYSASLRRYNELATSWSQFVQEWNEGRVTSKYQFEAVIRKSSLLHTNFVHLASSMQQQIAAMQNLSAAYVEVKAAIRVTENLLHRTVGELNELARQQYQVQPFYQECLRTKDLLEQAIREQNQNPFMAADLAKQYHKHLVATRRKIKKLVEFKGRAEKALGEFIAEVTDARVKDIPQTEQVINEIADIYADSCLEEPRRIFKAAVEVINHCWSRLPQLQHEISMDAQNWQEAIQAMVDADIIIQQAKQSLSMVRDSKATLLAQVEKVQSDLIQLEVDFDQTWEYCLMFIYDMPEDVLRQLQKEEERLEYISLGGGKMDAAILSAKVKVIQERRSFVALLAEQHHTAAKQSRAGG